MDAFEMNFSCPHGMPERKMGMALGQDCELLHEVCGWAKNAANIPVWAKMTPNGPRPSPAPAPFSRPSTPQRFRVSGEAQGYSEPEPYICQLSRGIRAGGGEGKGGARAGYRCRQSLGAGFGGA